MNGQSGSQVESSPDRVGGRSQLSTEGRSEQNAPATGGSGSSSNATGGAGASSESAAAASASATVNLTTQQKTEIRKTVINNYNAPRVANTNLNVGVGAAVPASVSFAPLPPAVVRIAPAWRGYYYFLYRGEIVLVDPHTHRIVAILPA